MKRITAMLLLLCLCVSMAGCTVPDYLQAQKLYEQGQYAQALPLFAALGDFADSAQMAQLCETKDAYLSAQALYDAGEYAQALPLYEQLQMHADSPVKAVMCRYQLGIAAVAAADYETALQWLDPLGGYADSAQQARRARWLWLGQSRYTLVLQEDAQNFVALSLEPVEADVLQLRLECIDYLLGLPTKSSLVLTLGWDDPNISYSAAHSSTSVSAIYETGTGTATRETLLAGGRLPLDTFTQTVTAPEEEPFTSTDADDAIMLPAMMQRLLEQLLENLPALLEKTGVDAVAADLGL